MESPPKPSLFPLRTEDSLGLGRCAPPHGASAPLTPFQDPSLARAFWRVLGSEITRNSPNCISAHAGNMRRAGLGAGLGVEAGGHLVRPLWGAGTALGRVGQRQGSLSRRPGAAKWRAEPFLQLYLRCSRIRHKSAPSRVT